MCHTTACMCHYMQQFIDLNVWWADDDTFDGTYILSSSMFHILTSPSYASSIRRHCMSYEHHFFFSTRILKTWLSVVAYTMFIAHFMPTRGIYHHLLLSFDSSAILTMTSSPIISLLYPFPLTIFLLYSTVSTMYLSCHSSFLQKLPHIPMNLPILITKSASQPSSLLVNLMLVLLRSQPNAKFFDFLFQKMTYFRCFAW